MPSSNLTSTITLFQRKRDNTTFSIEILFSLLFIAISLSTQKEIRALVAPYFSHSAHGIFLNVIWAFRSQTKINHIVGDIHYTILLLSSKNLNILTIHDCYLLHKLNPKGLKYRVYKKLWFDWPVQKADIITTISEFTKNDIIRFTNCPPEKIQVIPNFFNPDFTFTPQNFNQSTPVILHIGTGSNKNLNRLIEAINGINCILYIVGTPDETCMHLLKKYNINFKKFVAISNEEIIKLYQDCDIVFFASLFEGFGMPIIEAQATGRPVITSDRSPMREVAGAGACLVNPESIEAIQNAINLIIHDESYRNALISFGLLNCQKYSIDSIKQQYLDIYNLQK